MKSRPELHKLRINVERENNKSSKNWNWDSNNDQSVITKGLIEVIYINQKPRLSQSLNRDQKSYWRRRTRTGYWPPARVVAWQKERKGGGPGRVPNHPPGSLAASVRQKHWTPRAPGRVQCHPIGCSIRLDRVSSTLPDGAQGELNSSFLVLYVFYIKLICW